MNAFKLLVILFVQGLLAVLVIPALAQEDDSIEQHKDFQVTVGVGLSLRGPIAFTNFKLVDELGLEYDVMSLLRDEPVREMVHLSEEQFAEMCEIQSLAKKTMSSMALSAIASDKNDEIEQRFREFEDELRLVMEPAQVEMLEQVKIRFGIEKYGIARYLGSNAMKDRLDFSDQELDSLAKSEKEFKSIFGDRRTILVREANEALIGELSDERQEIFKRLLNDDETNRFLETALFTEKNALTGRESKNQRSLLSLLARRDVRAELKLDEAQFSDIKDLKRRLRELSEAEIAESLAKVLQPQQVELLELIGIRIQVSKVGTVNALSFGLLSEKLGLSEEGSSRIYESGERLYEELVFDSRQAKNETLRESLNSLSADHQEQVIELIGEAKVERSERLPN